MTIQVIDPRIDERWEEHVAEHAKSSIFHERGWLGALSRTYGFEPFAITRAAKGDRLCNSLVACRVSSWLTGRRVISLPFSDHCEPLVESERDVSEFLGWFCANGMENGAKYVELRPLTTLKSSGNSFVSSHEYYWHTIDLTPPLSTIYAKLHRDSMQRRIRRAEGELTCEVGRSAPLLDEFYRLLVITRRRHCVPPQPRMWFKNLVQCMGEKLEVRVARKQNLVIAAILTLRHKSTVVYKYGGSDESYHYLGGMPFLFWNLIEASKASGAAEIDLGRCDPDNQGLITFKDRLGSKRCSIHYYRYPSTAVQGMKARLERAPWERVFRVLPTRMMPAIGKVVYRHLG